MFSKWFRWRNKKLNIDETGEQIYKNPSNNLNVLLNFIDDEDILRDFGLDLPDETEYVLDSQPIFKAIINKAVDSGTILFFPMEAGLILDCPSCKLPAELKFQAIDEYNNKMFLISCGLMETEERHNLWVDQMYIEYILDKKAGELT